jgi:hypothetical protein
MAAAAIVGSHLISSTQAGALSRQRLAKSPLFWPMFNPFFRFATDYVYDTGESLIAGYAKRRSKPICASLLYIILLISRHQYWRSLFDRRGIGLYAPPPSGYQLDGVVVNHRCRFLVLFLMAVAGMA